jgi:hypothetical protein
MMVAIRKAKGVGRPPFPAARQEPMEDERPQPRESRAADTRQERRRRKDMSDTAHLRFAVPDHLRDDKRYRYHWLVDRAGRIEQKTQRDDWDFVEEPEIVADGRQAGAGTRIERHAGVDQYGNPQRAYLVRKLREYDEEDKAAGQKRLDARMKAIKRGKTKDDEGETIHDDGSYVPSRGISIQENYNP